MLQISICYKHEDTCIRQLLSTRQCLLYLFLSNQPYLIKTKLINFLWAEGETTAGGEQHHGGAERGHNEEIWQVGIIKSIQGFFNICLIYNKLGWVIIHLFNYKGTGRSTRHTWWVCILKARQLGSKCKTNDNFVIWLDIWDTTSVCFLSFRFSRTNKNSRWLNKEKNNKASCTDCFDLYWWFNMLLLLQVTARFLRRYYCNFHVQEYKMSNVTEIQTLINAALTSNHENDSIAVQPTDLVIKHIGTFSWHKWKRKV